MKDYKINGKIIEITLDNGKVVKCGAEWANKSIKLLNTDLEDVLLMWLEDNGYLENEEQEELDKNAKGKVKLVASADKPKKKTPKERVQKDNPDKEMIISHVAKYLEELNASNITIENKAKLITFTLNNKEFKLDLVEKRKPKAK